MISTDGAALIATVYPVGLLILGVEARAVLRQVAQDYGPVRRLIVFAYVAITGFSGSMATAFCVIQVSIEEPMGGWTAVFVWIVGMLLMLGVPSLLVLIPLASMVGDSTPNE